MGPFPRGFAQGLLIGGALVALLWVVGERRRREIVIGKVLEKTGGTPFPGPRIYTLLAEQLMGGVYRAVAEDVVAETKSGELLEIGSGTGHLAVEIGRRARDLEITTMDDSANVVRLAESRIHAAGLGRQIKVALGNVKEIPFPSGSFDVAISLGAFHRWRAPDLVLDEIYRVLKSGGIALIYDVRRELEEEEDWERIRHRVPALVRPFFELGTMGSWRDAFTEDQIRDVIASSPFLLGRFNPMPMNRDG